MCECGGDQIRKQTQPHKYQVSADQLLIQLRPTEFSQTPETWDLGLYIGLTADHPLYSRDRVAGFSFVLSQENVKRLQSLSPAFLLVN